MNRYNTPLRYPGGKQRLTPFVREVMALNGLTGGTYVEPFAGGSGVAIELLLDGTASRVYLNDANKAVYAFWRSVLSHTDALCRRIKSAALTVDEWRRQRAIVLNPASAEPVELGFSFLYLNRCNRSGIVSGGVIGGLQQTGRWKMDARFPRNELIRRIEAIAERRKKVTVTNLDAEKFISSKLPSLDERTLVYFDPPYYHAGRRLYLNHYKPEDHARLAKLIQQKVKLPWLVSYDTTPETLALYSKRRSFVYDLQYNAAKAYLGREVFVFSDKLNVPSSSSLKELNAAVSRIAVVADSI